MKFNFKPLFPLSLFLFPVFLATFEAQALGLCEEDYQIHGAYVFQKQQENNGSCFLSVDPANPKNLVYRSFLFTDKGLFMVFNSYGDLEGSDGARVFRFFPQGQNPDFIAGENQQTHIRLSTPGMELILSQKEEKVIGMKGAKIEIVPEVSKENQGGIEILNSEALYLDSGFRLGNDPTLEANRKSTFVDSRNQRCQVRNREVFQYLPDGDVKFKFSDSALKKFLQSRCPDLKVNF